MQGTGMARARAAIAAAALAAAAGALIGPAGASAAGAYEPNNSTLEAAGPLAVDQSVTAELETAEDRDFYYFYVTAQSAEETELTLLNRGGGTGGSDVDMAILDSLGTLVTGQSFILHDETRPVRAALAPGKYYVELTSSQGFGATYTLSAASGPLGPYSQIAARCGAGQSAVAKAKHRLRKALGRLQRSVARRRRSRFLGAEARRKARHAQARARREVATARAELHRARGGVEPWCSIAE